MNIHFKIASMKNIFLLISVVLMAGCIRDAENIKLPGGTPKLVIGSFISPQDTLLSVSVTQSYPVGKVITNDGVVKDAQVVLSDGITSQTLSFDDKEEKYTGKPVFPISGGQTYYLTVQAPDGRSVKASCTIPSTKDTTLTVAVDSANTDQAGYLDYYVRAGWTDIAGETNWYKINVEFIMEDTVHQYLYSNIFNFSTTENPIYSDEGKDGQKFATNQGDVYIYNPYSFSYPPQNKKFYKAYILVYLLTIDQNYYKYYESLNNVSSDPFAEPMNLYSNIEGGLGVFAGYQKHTVRRDVNLPPQ